LPWTLPLLPKQLDAIATLNQLSGSPNAPPIFVGTPGVDDGLDLFAAEIGHQGDKDKI
jgi:hypothetical protein